VVGVKLVFTLEGQDVGSLFDALIYHFAVALRCKARVLNFVGDGFELSPTFLLFKSQYE
jgi:hypothetical protein